MKVAYTTPVHDAPPRELVEFAPVVYQRFYRRLRDWRLVVVGRRVFAVACDSQRSVDRFDIRKGKIGETVYVPLKPPKHVVDGLLTVLDELGIDYCSADFIEDMSGTFFFIDLNVAGAWWWVDEVLAGEIRSAIADFLEGVVETRI